jgi:predicted HTH transcriptional regulator
VDDLFSQARSQNKISKDVLSLGDVSIATIDGRDLIVISIRPADRRVRPIFLKGQAYGGTYLRRSTGDYAASPDEVNRMMREASDLSADAVILSGYGIEDLDQSAISAYQRLVLAHDPVSPTAEFDDLQLLQHIEAWQRDRHIGDEGLTVAGLLMFGTDAAIRDWRVRHLIDARLLPAGAEVGEPDWADRIVWEGHLFGA